LKESGEGVPSGGVSALRLVFRRRTGITPIHFSISNDIKHLQRLPLFVFRLSLELNPNPISYFNKAQPVVKNGGAVCLLKLKVEKIKFNFPLLTIQKKTSHNQPHSIQTSF